MKLVNLTPHDITILDFYKAQNIIPASGKVCRIATQTEGERGLDLGNSATILLCITRTSSIIDLPAPEEGTIYIVSMPVAQEVARIHPERTDVYAPDTGDTCIREKGQIVAVQRLHRFVG